MSYIDTAPLPLEPLEDKLVEERRLWIGNLDPHITEYQLLKLLQKHGAIEKFDLLFHRTGPQAGQPRGYAFVTYMNLEDAIKARLELDGKMLGTKRVALRPANSVNKEDLEKPKVELKIAALSGGRKEHKVSRETTIRAIEAKLKTMEHDPTAKEFEIVLPKNQRPSPSVQSSRITRHNKPYIKRNMFRR